MADWNPKQYLSFENERAQPVLDLLARLGKYAPHRIIDVGCGPGNSTALLQQHFPDAVITAFDSSPAMIEAAKLNLPGIEFAVQDLQAWQPDGSADLVFSNAVFQWIPHHAEELQRILSDMKAGGVLALQMPDNLDEPSHRLMRATAEEGPWRSRLQQAAAARTKLLSVPEYHELLRPLALEVVTWRTTYFHELDGHQGIVDLLSSTGLKPFLDPLDHDQRANFIAQYRSLLAEHYPVQNNGKVLYAFPRIFIVAVSAGISAGR